MLKTLKEDIILELEDVSYAYSDNKTALENISIKIKSGEKIALLGGNGAGKTTFFLVCNGILKPQNGKLIFRGQEIKGKKSSLMNLRKEIGIVFQDADNQIIASTVSSEISFGPLNLRLKDDEILERVNDALNQMNLAEYKTRAPQYLSGGEKKRVTIADILAMRPSLILLDEPTASLDPENVDLLEQALEKLNKAGITLVVSTHDVDFAYRFAQRAVVFKSGKIIADGPINSIFLDDTLISKAKLKKPLLYEVAEIIREKYGVNTALNYAKNIEEFKNILK